MPTKLTLARAIRDKRVRAGLSQSEAAKAAGIRRATWTALESGTANPRLSTIEVVAYVLNCDVAELFKEEEGLMFDDTSNPES
jgi:transcriptional regulator with XRE-family HTH domain